MKLRSWLIWLCSLCVLNAKQFHNIYYTHQHSEEQTLDLYVPEQMTANAVVPVIVWIHGGGWAAGDKKNCPPFNAGFTRHGYAVVSINYRLSKTAVFPARIEDVKRSVFNTFYPYQSIAN